ncbi:MAG: Hsp20 family protein, partial [Deltaproteobacteria bacterium]|nr:Hsp20 family protein [Deltaproteobacteria bacterium]
MTMTRWVPRDTGVGFGDRLDRELRLMGRLFDDVLRNFDREAEGGEPEPTFPRVDLVEAADEYVMRADLPGLRREDVELDVAADHVVVRGKYAQDESF